MTAIPVINDEQTSNIPISTVEQKSFNFTIQSQTIISSPNLTASPPYQMMPLLGSLNI